MFRRWDKEAEPTYQHMWDTQPQMDTGELQVDQMVKKLMTWGAKKADGPDGWARSEWKQMTLEMVKPMRDMMTKMEQTVENKTLEQLMEKLV